MNRGKNCITLDLQTNLGLQEARLLIAEADVMIEGFRPGVMKRLGLGPEACRASNPGLIYLSLPGYASSDEEMRETKAFEAILMARSGVFSGMGLNRTLRGIDPSYSPLPLASVYSSVLAALSVSLALFAREDHGVGDVIEVPLAAGLKDALVYNSMEMSYYPERYKCVREREIERREEEGLPMNLSYKAITEILDPFYCTYFCKDDRPFYVVAPCHYIHQKKVLQALGVYEELKSAGMPEGKKGDIYSHSEKWEAESVLGTYPISSPKWIVEIKARMREAFRARPSSK